MSTRWGGKVMPKVDNGNRGCKTYIFLQALLLRPKNVSLFTSTNLHIGLSLLDCNMAQRRETNS